MTCPTCDRPPADESRPATLGPGESCGCNLTDREPRAKNDPRRVASILRELARMRCEFKPCDDDQTCNHCERPIAVGVNIYFVPGPHDCPNDGYYVCRRCAEKTIELFRCKRCLFTPDACPDCRREEAEHTAYWHRIATTGEDL